MMKFTVLIVSLFASIVTIYAQGNINLVSNLPVPNVPIHDVWGYTDPNSGNRYALLGASTSGLRVIDLSDINNPTLVGTISGNGVQAIDVKTWENYAYVVGESISLTGKIIDLSDPTLPVQVGSFPGGHNISITESGYMYLSTPGLRIFDLTDPINPVQVYSDNSCNGHDISIIGDTLYDFTDNCGTKIYDISQADNPLILGSIPPSGIFHHSGWPSQDGNYLFICDELATSTENDITVWDISTINSPTIIDSFLDPTAYVHNLYVQDNYALVSYYRAGFRLFNVFDPFNITMVDEYDTDPSLSGPGYGGNFGLFTFWGNDTILASDEENGLFIFSLTNLTASTNEFSQSNVLDFSIQPNPANNYTEISYTLNKDSKILISIYSIDGTSVTEILNANETKGNYNVNVQTNNFSSGIYIVKINIDDFQITKKLIVN